jgi:hypothetical protein
MDAPGRTSSNISTPAISGKKVGKGSKGRRSTKKTLKMANGITSGILTPPRA